MEVLLALMGKLLVPPRDGILEDSPSSEAAAREGTPEDGSSWRYSGQLQ